MPPISRLGPKHMADGFFNTVEPFARGVELDAVGGGMPMIDMRETLPGTWDSCHLEIKSLHLLFHRSLPHFVLPNLALVEYNQEGRKRKSNIVAKINTRGPQRSTGCERCCR